MLLDLSAGVQDSDLPAKAGLSLIDAAGLVFVFEEGDPLSIIIANHKRKVKEFIGGVVG